MCCYQANRETNIKVKTGVGTTKSATVGETVAQGSIGGGLASSLNLEVNNFFNASMDEAAYSNIRLQPLVLQDDLARLCSSVESARAGLHRIETIMKLKQLSLNVDKSSFIICRNSSMSANIKEDLEQNPLIYDGVAIKEKESEKDTDAGTGDPDAQGAPADHEQRLLEQIYLTDGQMSFVFLLN